MQEAPKPSNLDFLRQRFEKEAKRDVLPLMERIGQLVGIVFIFIFIIIFAAHLSSNTGFFKSNFGAFEAVLFFGIGIYGIFPSFLRFFLGRRNKVRPFDFISYILILFTGIYFLAIWPFDFTHVADVLPVDIQFIVSWVSDQFVQLLMIFGIFIMTIVSILELLTYFGVKEILDRNVPPQPPIEPVQPA